ncbi:MAG: LytTR family DNA-binding domain-containing protein [Bacteroidota bacterium]
MNCVVIDDEQPARALIKEYINRVPSLNFVGEFKSPLEAIAFIQQQSPDVLFLDIQMPGLTGLEFIQTLTNPPFIILTTAYSQYAVEGFDLNVTDYLLKPIEFGRFLKAVNKVELKTAKVPNPNLTTPKEEEELLLKADGEVHRIKINDIQYIEGMREYVSFFLKEKKLIVLESLTKLESTLPITQFLRIHKSYIINLDAINSYNLNQVTIGQVQIPVGRNYKEAFKLLVESRF